MTTAKTPAAKKVAAPRKRAPRKATAAPQTSEPTQTVSVVDPDVYVPPTGLTDGFKSDGTGPALSKLTPRALENLTFMATDNVTPESEGNTPQARKYWTRVLARHGVTV